MTDWRVYQGLTLVISPLIALMKDQVDALVALGVKAASLDSTQPMDRTSWIKDEVLNGNMKILFVAPERYAIPHCHSTCILKITFRLNNEVSNSFVDLYALTRHGSGFHEHDAKSQDIVASCG